MKEVHETLEESRQQKMYLQIWSGDQIETREVPAKELEVVDETERGLHGHIGLAEVNRCELGSVGDVIELIDSETGISQGLRVIGKFPLSHSAKSKTGLTVTGIEPGSRIVVVKYLPEALATHKVRLHTDTVTAVGDRYGLKIPPAYAKLMEFHHPEGSNKFSSQIGKVKIFKSPNDPNPVQKDVQMFSGGGELRVTVDCKQKLGLPGKCPPFAYVRVINKILEIYLS